MLGCLDPAAGINCLALLASAHKPISTRRLCSRCRAVPLIVLNTLVVFVKLVFG